MTVSSIDEDVRREEIRALALAAGFVRVRFLAPWMPPDDPGVPENYRAGAPALLTAALAYGNVADPPGDAPAALPRFPARIAPFAQRNYYAEATARLKALARTLRLRYGGVKADYRVLCNSPVPERPPALASGLGWIGRNGLLITPEAGSLVIIAALTLPFSLAGDPPLASGGDGRAPSAGAAGPGAADFPACAVCASSGAACVAACPTGALRGDGSLDRTRCIQWYASGDGETVPADVRAAWGDRLYGCTLCQDACPHNRRRIPGTPTQLGPLPAAMDAAELVSQSDDQLRERFRGTAMGLSWLGPRAIRRSAELALAGARDAAERRR